MEKEKTELPKWIVMVVNTKKCYPAYSRSEAYRLKAQLSKGKVGVVVVRKMVTL